MNDWLLEFFRVNFIAHLPFFIGNRLLQCFFRPSLFYLFGMERFLTRGRGTRRAEKGGDGKGLGWRNKGKEREKIEREVRREKER